jgi:outer membrane protein assembly factor BamB
VEGAVVPGAQAPKHMMGDKEFLHPDSMGADRSHTFKVFCLDGDTGKILWERTAYEGRVFDNRHRQGAYAATTPVTDGRYVYVFFGSEGLYCYDFDGQLMWKTSLGNLATMGMGVGTSPVLHEDLVILQCDQEFSGADSFLAAVHQKTGKLAWKVPRTDPVSWATPILLRSGGRAELVTSGAKNVISYDPASGKELWRSSGVEGNAIPSPVAGHGMVFVSAGYPVKRAYGLRLGGSGALAEGNGVAWKYDKGTAYVPSPILYGDYLYLMTDSGLLTCLDAKTGQVKYEGARPPVPARFFASPVAYEGKILLTSQDGDTFVLKAGPVHEVLRTNPLGEPVYASLAMAAGKIFIRSEKNLYCIGKQ